MKAGPEPYEIREKRAGQRMEKKRLTHTYWGYIIILTDGYTNDTL